MDQRSGALGRPERYGRPVENGSRYARTPQPRPTPYPSTFTMPHLATTLITVRAEPAPDARSLGRLPRHTLVTLLQGPDRHGWSRISARLIDGVLTGWVAHHRLRPATAVPVAPQPVATEPAWLTIARGELGIREYPGAQHNPRIVAYHAATSLGASTDETAWCSSFVNWCMKQGGYTGTNSAAARSWLQWAQGTKLTTPRPGAITVFKRGNNPAQGHVAFFIGNRGNYVDVLGGNQSNQVKVSAYPAADLLGWRWPRND